MAGIIFSEGSNVANSIYGKSQEPIKMLLEKRAEAFEQKSVLKKLFSIEKSNKWAEKLTSMNAMDGFQPVGENGAYPLVEWSEGPSKVIIHETWKNSFMLSKELIDDAQALDLRKRPAAFMTAFERTKELFGAQLYGAILTSATTIKVGAKTFDATGADGKAILATNHQAARKGANQSNMFTDAFSADALAAVETEMQNFKGDSGEILDVAPDTIVIPNIYTLKKAVFSAIGADHDPATANNGFNYQFGRWNVIVWSYLNQYMGSTNTAPWLLIDSRYNDTYKGAVIFEREPLTIRSTIDENTDANVWRGRTRFGGGFNDWRFVAGGGLTGGTTLIS